MDNLFKSFSDFASGAPVSEFSLSSIRLWLIELVDNHYWLALFAFAAVGFYILLNVFKAARNAGDLLKMLGLRGRRLVPTVLLAAGSILLAFVTTENIRQTGIPVPTSVEKTEIVSKEEKVLQWRRVKAGPGERVRYQVQWSRDPSFPSDGSDVFDTDETVVLVKPRWDNTEVYWRVRAILIREGAGLRRYGRWTETAQIDNYRNALERIYHTGRLRVGVDRSFGRSFMRFLKPTGEQWDGSYIERGLEPELAYRIAFALCRELIEKREHMLAGCGPSNDRSAGDSLRATSGRTRRIEVEFVALEGKDSVLEAVGAGEVDLTLSSFVEKPERVTRFHVQFSRESYYETGIAMLYSPLRPLVKRDDIANAVIGVEDKTAVSACMREYLKKHSGDKEWADRIITVSAFHEAPRMLERALGPKFIFTNEPYASGWALRYNVKCALVPAEMFVDKEGDVGDGYPDYCRGLKYRVAVRVGETELLDIVDAVIRDENDRRKSAFHMTALHMGLSDYQKYMSGKREAQCEEAPWR